MWKNTRAMTQKERKNICQNCFYATQKNGVWGCKNSACIGNGKGEVKITKKRGKYELVW